MKIFAIRDAAAEEPGDLAYLLYYEADRRFYIELLENADPWETPLLLSTFVKNGEHTVNSYWSKIWVRQRIVPPERQNIGQILRDNDLESYDEYALLMLSQGRCEQDDYYLVPVDEKTFPNEVVRRFSRRIEDVVPLENNSLVVFFRDGMIRRCEMNEYFDRNPRFTVLMSRPDYFSRVTIQTGGYGIQWDDELFIMDWELYDVGERVPLRTDDFHAFVSQRIINVSEAAMILNCSRQYISELVKTDKLHPVKSSEKSTLFLKSEVLKRSWQ